MSYAMKSNLCVNATECCFHQTTSYKHVCCRCDRSDPNGVPGVSVLGGHLGPHKSRTDCFCVRDFKC